MTFKLIIFDCWGTLFTNTSPYLPRVAERLGQSMRDYDFVKVLEETIMLGNKDVTASFQDLVERVTKKENPTLAKELEDIYLESRKNYKVFPETQEVLELLDKKYQIGMITNSSRLGLDILKENSPLFKHFSFVLASYETKILKPDPAVFKLALKKAGVTPTQALMVGDNLRDDCEAAEACGIRSVLIDRNNRYPHVKEKITDLRQLFSQVIVSEEN